MKLKELDPETRDTFEETIESAFAECEQTGHAMHMETGSGGFLFIDTERGRDNGVIVMSHEELIILVWDTHH